MSPVAYGLSHFAFGIFRHSAELKTFIRSWIKELFAGAPFPIARTPLGGNHREVTIG
jgi:hypothetical protein